jgi:RHS repeat-associated protein
MTLYVRILLACLAFALATPAIAQTAMDVQQESLCIDDCDPGDGTTEPPPPPPPALALDAGFVSQSVPTTMAAGQAYTVVVAMKNTGSETWLAGSVVRLGSQNPQDNTSWGTGRVALPISAPTGQIVSFSFSVRAPATSGNFNFQWQMVKDGVAWFGGTSANVVVKVTAPNTPPVVTLSSPVNAASIAAPASLTLAADASDTGGSIVSVSFWANGELLGTDASAPYTWPLTSLAAGGYQFRAVATDNEGAVASSAAVNLTVSGGARISATRRYIYDTNERLCKTINPESGATVVDYDAAGNVAWSAEGLALTTATCDRAQVANSAKLTRTYDALNRLKTVATPGGTADLQEEYYADGKVRSLAVMNPGKAKVTTSYSYNRRGLLMAESSANGSTLFGLVYAYDKGGSLASLTYPDNHVVSFAPDALGRATRVTGTGGVVYAKDITYTPGGAILGFKYGNEIVHAREGNARQLPSRSLDSYWNGTAEVKVIDDRYAYDPNGNVTDITDVAQNGLTTRGMAYDGLDRLKAAVSPLQWGNAAYGYDGLDNLRIADHGARQYRYNYDAANRLANIKNPAGTTLITLAYDARGNTTSKNSQAFVFDAVNRMNQVTGQQVYRYDGQGRRVQTTDADGKTTFWIYSQSGQVLYTSEARRNQNLAYIYLGNTQVATRAVAWGSGTATIRYQHTDALGSPVAETDILRNIVKRNSFTPYGETFGSTVVDGTGYTGHVMDRATGLTYMQQRYYDPQVARFLSIDPVTAYSNGDMRFLSRYTYAFNNPFAFTDPDGRETGPAFRAIYLADSGQSPGGQNAGPVAELIGDAVLSGAIDVALGGPTGEGAAIFTGIRASRAAGKAAGAAKGAAGGSRAGKAHTRAANRLGREQNKAANGGEMRCPTCGKKMNEPVQSKKGEPIDRDAAVGDHVVAKSRGGDGATVRDMQNHETKCWLCNSKKSDK